MITPADDYPIHQTPEPIAESSLGPNAYDRYFFNGYSPDGRTYFALAMGFYPGLGVVDAAFSVQRDGVQHNIRASKCTVPMDLIDLQVGPIRIIVDEPLRRLSIQVDHEVVQARLEFTARCEAIQEPRFTRKRDGEAIFDYTRMTQNGNWEGSIAVQGIVDSVESLLGTRDRSWGIRPLAANAVPNARQSSQFFWLWTPLNFPDYCVFYHLNADGEGKPWNQSGVIVDPFGCEAATAHSTDSSLCHSELVLGPNRRITAMTIHVPAHRDSEKPGFVIDLAPIQPFYMSGLGYTHPAWGHGVNHGELDVSYDEINIEDADDSDPLHRHVQVLCSAKLRDSQSNETLSRGHGVIEQLFIGRYKPLNLE